MLGEAQEGIVGADGTGALLRGFAAARRELHKLRIRQRVVTHNERAPVMGRIVRAAHVQQVGVEEQRRAWRHFHKYPLEQLLDLMDAGRVCPRLRANLAVV